MTTASLLLKQDSSASLSTLVEKALQKKPPFLQYELQLNTSNLLLIQRSSTDKFPRTSQTDEGFESDIDTLSIVSSDDSFTSGNLPENTGKTPAETDSANGSASSDSDTDSPSNHLIEQQSYPINHGMKIQNEHQQVEYSRDTYNLVNCICYTDLKYNEILVFVIESKALVFKFDNISNLEAFYKTFAAVKAVNNQALHNRNTLNRKFNLLHKTDGNGITHIQITREPSNTLILNEGPSSIISINTPEDNLNKLIKSPVPHIKSLNEFNNSNTINKRFRDSYFQEVDHRKFIDKSASANDLLDLENEDSLRDIRSNNGSLRKIWNSSENILGTLPKRPERKKKSKGKAPLPPDVEIKQDILSGQYIRVNVKTENKESMSTMKTHLKEAHPKKLQGSNFLTSKPSLNFLVKNKATQILKYAPKKFETSTLTRHKTPPRETWTNSIPRFFKQPRSRSESRVLQPMAYRYIDTTMNFPVTYVPMTSTNSKNLKSHELPYSFGASQSHKTQISGAASTIGNRLFGLSPKLKDFSSQGQDKTDGKWKTSENRRESGETHLKSVIKKDENRRKNEKKVTFSAYTTVQVV